MKYLVPLLLFAKLSFGQSVTGKIVDSTTTPLPFATIALLNAQDSLTVTGALTDEKGDFTIKTIRPGTYLLKITSFGYNPKITEPIFIDSASVVSLPFITLHTSDIKLDEVSVSAIKRTVEFKNGNIIVTIENSPLAKGNTVYDLLFKLPGVSVDNNVIQLNGKPGVVILMDGRVQQLTNLQLINMLKSMNAELVEKIELLKNPPVKYDAAGTSGMINIKTRKTKQVGISGSIYTSDSQGFYGRSMSGFALNYWSDKIVLFTNMNYNYGYYQSIETFHKRFKSDTSLTEFTSYNTVKDIENSLNYKVGADWFINKKNILGVKVDGGPGSYISDNSGSNRVSGYNDLGFDHLKALVYVPDKWDITNYNINAEHRFDTTGTLLSFSADYTNLSENHSSSIRNLFFDASNLEVLSPITYRSGNVSKTGIIASRLDFTKALNEVSSLELGIKTSFVNTGNNYVFERKDNTSGNYYSDTALSNNYTYTEQTYAAYVNYTRSFKKGTLRLGLRAENTNLTGRNTVKAFELKRSYYNLFPNVSLDYNLSENHNLQLNLNRRIDRPAYESLNPFRTYRDQYAYFEGNPFLLPHYSNTIELTHSYKEFIAHALTYSRIDNVMLPYTMQNDSAKLTIETTKNMKVNNYYAYALFMQHSIKPWWELSFNGVFSYIEYKGDVSGTPFTTASFYYDPTLTNTFTAPKNTKIEVMAFYHSAKNNGLVQVRPRWMLSLAVKKTFLQDKLDCSIGVNDIFYSAYYRTDVNFNNQDWNFMVTQDSRRLVVSLTYNFGRTKVQERETNSNGQEKDRLSH